MFNFNWLNEQGVFGWNLKYLIWHPMVLPVECYRRVKWFIQRGRKGFSEADGWGLHDYLSQWLPEALRGLKSKYGTPIAMYPENMTMEDIDHTTKEEGEAAHLRWHTALEDMALGFEAVKAMGEELPFPHTDRYKELKAQRDKGLALFVEHFECLWD